MTKNTINLSRYSDLCFEYTLNNASGNRTTKCTSLGNSTDSRYIIFQGYKSTDGVSYYMQWGTTNINSTYATPAAPGYEYYGPERSAYTFYIHSVYLIPKTQTGTIIWNAIRNNESVTATQATATYTGGALTGSISGTAVESTAPRLIFNNKITNSGILHIKGTINLNTSSSIPAGNAGIAVIIGTSTNSSNVLHGHVLYGMPSKGQDIPFVADIPVSQGNTYLTLGFGRTSESISGGSYYATYRITELYIYN